MTQLTTLLGDESGVQYNGISGGNEETQVYPIEGLIVGYFRRGRFDKPMTITNANIRAMLGYDFQNPYYRMVQDILNEDIPSVQVLRLVENDGVSGMDGLSAYEEAVQDGYSGTVTEWLLSLKGMDGATGATGAAGANGTLGNLSGINIQSANGPINENDNILTALAKLQKQLNIFGVHSHNGIIDLGGEGYYPFDVTEGTLYTASQNITIPTGYYRIAAAGVYQGDNLEDVSVRRTLTDEYILSNEENEYYALAKFEGTDQTGIGGWRLSGNQPEQALKLLFTQAPELAKGPNGRGTKVGGISDPVRISRIHHFLEPTELTIILPVFSNDIDYYKSTAGTGFVWIRQVAAP